MPEIDVAIIGAGAAGLAAARALSHAGSSVAVFEGRDRVGGRVFGTEGVELGAEFIHGPAPQTRALLAEIGAHDVENGWESWDDHGTLEPSETEFGGYGPLLRDVAALSHDESVDDYLGRLRGRDVDDEVLRGLREFVEGFDAADTARASIFGIAKELLSGVDDRSARSSCGYRPLFDHLQRVCAEAGVQFYLASPVRNITWKRGEVTIGATRARAAIVTVPVGVLQSDDVAFDPPLPPAKQQAVDSIAMGSVVKVVLRFRSAFWRALQGGRFRDAGFFRTSREPFRVFWTQFPANANTLVAWIGGPRAEAMRSLSREAVIASALSECGAMFGEPAVVQREFVDAFFQDWDNDPFARGAYSYLLVGGGDARVALAESIERTLFFAGEATVDDGQGGTVNGAFASGERAAREVAAALGAKKA